MEWAAFRPRHEESTTVGIDDNLKSAVLEVKMIVAMPGAPSSIRVDF